MAGIVPGLLIGVGLCRRLVVRGAQGERGTPPPRKPGRAAQGAARARWALVLPVIIIFGLKFGLFTPTEAAVVAAVYALFVSAVVYREMKLSRLLRGLRHAAKITSVVIFLVAAALVSAWLITIANLPAQGGRPALAVHGQPAPADVR